MIKKFIKITREFKLEIELPFNSEYYPNMTIDQAVAYELEDTTALENFFECFNDEINEDNMTSNKVEIVEKDD